MSFNDIFQSVQDCECYTQALDYVICENKLKSKVELLSGSKIFHLKMDMSPENTRGYFFKLTDTEISRLGKGNFNLVLTPRSYSSGSDWERFVLAKELMHAFEGNGTQTEISLRELVTDFSVTPPKRSLDMESEHAAFWKGLSLLCHEEDRAKLIEESRNREISYSGVASRLNIPEKYVFNYFRPDYLSIIRNYGAPV